MNERIRELFDQAHKEFSQEHKFSTVILPNPLKEKFAELIVQECVNVLHDNELWSRDVSHVLKEHFGVK